MTENAGFDAYAEDYDAALAQGIAVSGEDKEFFARGRAEWLAARLRERGERVRSVLDFGCGTGSSTPYLLETLGAESLVGVDISANSLDVARRTYGDEARARFMLMDEFQPAAQFDLVFCNGVFHHIPLEQRAAAVDYVMRALRPAGLFAFWENNPWNPGTRYVMSRCPFDDDAITLSPPEARRLLVRGGFEILQTDFLFIFPNLLRWFRPLEPLVARLPLGAQYQVLGRRN
ncbi:MAG TPA: methyltransferase domain-containing protein [Pyrinomonadaceae bacterium]|jgi:SAM-dependent methyltransferase